jgi:hypothetical protein
MADVIGKIVMCTFVKHVGYALLAYNYARVRLHIYVHVFIVIF